MQSTMSIETESGKITVEGESRGRRIVLELDEVPSDHNNWEAGNHASVVLTARDLANLVNALKFFEEGN